MINLFYHKLIMFHKFTLEVEQSVRQIKVQHNANLIQMGLFFCHWFCEYTKSVSHQRTTQFQFRDIQVHNTVSVILSDAPDQTFLIAWATTLFLETQKNCVQGESTPWKQLVSRTTTLSPPQPDAFSTYAPTELTLTPPFAHTTPPLTLPLHPFQAVISHILFLWQFGSQASKVKISMFIQ